MAKISIHALTRSATERTGQEFSLDIFQSTHSRGVRRGIYLCIIMKFVFQSTHSRGVRRRRYRRSSKDRRFQSTHSRGVRLPSPTVFEMPVIFQSTHSRGVRPAYFVYCLSEYAISIHALTRSATFAWLPSVWRSDGFQSTHSRGVRLSKQLCKTTYK